MDIKIEISGECLTCNYWDWYFGSCQIFKEKIEGSLQQEPNPIRLQQCIEAELEAFNTQLHKVELCNS
jgi:hypothetical protein